VRENFDSVADEVLANPIIFGDYRNVLKPIEPRLYEDMHTFENDVRPLMEEVLEEYNLVYKPMNLVMFKDALEHLTRIHRIMRVPRVIK
jgi:dynein heavy chain